MRPITTILTHRDPDMDEVAAIYLLRKYGEAKYPGISKADIQTLGKRDFKENNPDTLESEGTLCVGIGGGRFDEHPSRDHGRREGDCAATLVAKDLGIVEGMPAYTIAAYALLKNYSAETEEFEIAPLEKLAFRYGSHGKDEGMNKEMEKRIFESCFLFLESVDMHAAKSGTEHTNPRSADECIAAWILEYFADNTASSLETYKLKALETKGSIAVQVAKAAKRSEDRVFYWILQYAKKHKTPYEISRNLFELSSLIALAENAEVPKEKIQDAVSVLLNALWHKYKNFFVDCKKDFNADSTRVATIEHGGNTLRVASLLSDNSEIAKYARSEYGGYSAVVIKRDPKTGNTQIFFNQKYGLDPKPVVKEIRKAERMKNGFTEELSDDLLVSQGKNIEGAEVWYFDGYQILNGSYTAEETPTTLSREEVEGAVMRGLRQTI